MAYCPIITIIVPTKNSANTLPELILSLKQQTSQEYEAIFVDYSSTDSTRSLLSAANIPRKIVDHDEPGIYQAINAGINKATTDWIMVLGSDDQLASPHTIARLREILSTVPISVAALYGTVRLASDGSLYNTAFSIIDHFTKSLCQQSIVYNRHCLLTMGLFPVTYRSSADYVLNLQLLSRYGADSFFYIDEIIANYNDSGFSSYYVDYGYLRQSLYIRLATLGKHVPLRHSIRAFIGRNGFVRYLLCRGYYNNIRILSIFAYICFQRTFKRFLLHP